MTNILTPTDLQNYFPDIDTSQYSATTLSGIISMATTRIAAYCDVVGFDQATEVLETDRTRIGREGEMVILVRRRPIVTVSGVFIKKGQFTSALVINDGEGNNFYDSPHPGNLFIYPNRYLAGTGTLLIGGANMLVTLKGADTFSQITYTGGYATFPVDLMLACSLMVREILAIQYNPLGAEQTSQGNYNVRFDQRGTAGRALGTQASRLAQAAYDILEQGGYVRRAV